MQAKVKKPFFDRKDSTNRAIDEVFECSAARLKEINSAGFGELVEKVQSPKKDEAKQEAEEG